MTQTKKRRIYISGPMRGRQFYNFPAFDAAKQALERIGYEVVSPADMDRELRHFDGLLCDPSDPCSGTPIYRDYVTGEPRKFDLDACIREDIDALLGCDVVFALEGWTESAGARAEIAVARWAGRKVFHGIGSAMTEDLP